MSNMLPIDPDRVPAVMERVLACRGVITAAQITMAKLANWMLLNETHQELKLAILVYQRELRSLVKTMDNLP